MNQRRGLAEGAVHGPELRAAGCERQRLLAILRTPSGECEGDRCARHEPHHAAQAEYRVQHRTDGARKQRSCFQRRRIRGGAAPSEKARPVRLELDVAANHRDVLGTSQRVQCPDRLLVSRPRAAAAQQSGYRTQVFRLQEEFSEGRMCLVGWARIQRNFRIAGDLQSARPFPVIQQRDAADLRVRVGNNRDLVQSFYVAIAPAQDAAVRPKFRLVLVRAAPGRLAPADQMLSSSKSRM